jgi:hypothetical protein
MIGWVSWCIPFMLFFVVTGCSGTGSSSSRSRPPSDLSPDERDAQVLGREIFELVDRAVVVTVRFRQPGGREIVSCWGESKILEDASVNGSYTLMCTASSGAQRQMEVVTSGEP